MVRRFNIVTRVAVLLLLISTLYLMKHFSSVDESRRVGRVREYLKMNRGMKEQIVREIEKLKIWQGNTMQYEQQQKSRKQSLLEFLASLKKMGFSGKETNLILSTFPYKSTGSMAFVAESSNDEKDKNISLACISEPFINNCYEDGSAGFASLVIITLDHLRFCHRNKGIPTVRWRNCYGGCKPDANIDSFPFYFKPLNIGIENSAKKVLCFGDSIWDFPDYLFSNALPTNNVQNVFGQISNKQKFKPVLDFSFRERSGLTDFYAPEDLITSQLRHEMNFILRKYLKVNSKIMMKVNQFYSEFMNDYNVLGIHVRGTDHWSENANFKLPTVRQWIDEADRVLQSLDEPRRIFLASDSHEVVSRFIESFGKEKVVHINAIRAKRYKDDDAVDPSRNNNPLQIGQQVFMDILLLAKCDYFLHAESNVASLASYFNPKMKSFFLGDIIINQMVTKNYQRNLKEFTLDPDIRQDHGRTQSLTNCRTTFSDKCMLEALDNVAEGIPCWRRNRDYSVCSNMKTGNFIKFSEFVKYYFS